MELDLDSGPRLGSICIAAFALLHLVLKINGEIPLSACQAPLGVGVQS